MTRQVHTNATILTEIYMKTIHFTHDVHMFPIFWMASNQKLTIQLLAMLQK